MEDELASLPSQTYLVHNEHYCVCVTTLTCLHSVWQNVPTSSDHNCCQRQAQCVQLDM